MGRRGRRWCRQLLDDFKGMRGYWKLKEAALVCILENSLWKMLWTSLKTDYRMNEWSSCEHLQPPKGMQKRSSWQRSPVPKTVCI
jgi:hypothetical protein